VLALGFDVREWPVIDRGTPPIDNGRQFASRRPTASSYTNSACW